MILDPTPAPAGLMRANATMIRGVDSLSGRLAGAREADNLISGYAQARLFGNNLRELDAFLAVLLDQAASCLGAGVVDRRRMAQRRNTHGRLSAMMDLLGADSPFDPRLCAVGAVRDCLHARGGRVSGGGHPAPALALHRLGAGMQDGAILLSAGSLLSIYAMYRAVSEQLVDAVGAWRGGDIDFSRRNAHLSCAIVACDGF
ncbi:hypothetical protein [Sphingomonas jatrophae]|uniref:Uncharacterized protein n=1 Tax=Sphingomonas jatrophae TaxID=1166337 RepID=A0A1I6KXV2_9SPHN|nr:hypothetical protein [Sphingomonas jatrophae]SFR96017.1 hypothetical protein SAMN05192580_1904 [Sphingomonas jatrophae]